MRVSFLKDKLVSVGVCRIITEKYKYYPGAWIDGIIETISDNYIYVYFKLWDELHRYNVGDPIVKESSFITKKKYTAGELVHVMSSKTEFIWWEAYIVEDTVLGDAEVLIEWADPGRDMPETQLVPINFIRALQN